MVIFDGLRARVGYVQIGDQTVNFKSRDNITSFRGHHCSEIQLGFNT